MQNADGIIYVYDITQRESFNNLKTWIRESDQATQGFKKIIVGNKIDLENNRIVSTEEAKQLCDDLEFDFFIESSAKTGFNADTIFVKAAKILYKEYLKLKNKENAVKILDNKKLNKDYKNKKKIKGCC